MAARNDEIAAKLEEIADLLEVESANPFRVRAYRNAARTLRSLATQVGDMLAKGADPSELPGIGADLAEKIGEIAASGTTAVLDRLHGELPAGLTELLRVPGLGPKRVKVLHDELGIGSLEQLRRSAEEGRLSRLPGFGRKTEERILQATRRRPAEKPRLTLAAAAPQAESILAWLAAMPGIGSVTAAGSYRRLRESVGDLDILATAREAKPVIDRFAAYEPIAEVLASGPTRATAILRTGLQIDLRVVGAHSYGSALHYFTGSKAHNIAIRRLGQQRGLKINEYGVFRGRRRVAGETEESVFGSVGLPWIPPELREDRGEIEAARAGRLPNLVEIEDLRGDLHCHTRASDGRSSLEEMAEAAGRHGFEYLAITEHSRRLGMAHGLDVRRLAEHVERIDRLNERLEGATLLKGIEVDILENGSLDLPDRALAGLDLVVGALHSHLNLPSERQTERILRAMDRPHFSILAHPSGRLLGTREASQIDMMKVIRAARQRGCHLELNAQPERLELVDIYCQAAKTEGVLVAIDSDAHSALDLDNLRFGVGQARRGWLGRSDVLNTRTLAELRPLLASTM